MQDYEIYSSAENEKLIMQLVASLLSTPDYHTPFAERVKEAIMKAEQIFVAVKEKSSRVNE